MSEEENKAIIRGFIEEVENQVNLDAIEKYIPSDFVDHGSYDITREKLVTHLKNLRAAFPDTHLRLKKQIAEGDLVANYIEFTGTHEGTFLGVPPTGKKFQFDILMIFRVVNGKLQEHWGMVDQLYMLQRLGLVKQYDWP